METLFIDIYEYEHNFIDGKSIGDTVGQILEEMWESMVTVL